MSQPLIRQILINLICPLRLSLRKFFKPVTSQNVPHECLIEEDDNAEVKGHFGMMRLCAKTYFLATRYHAVEEYCVMKLRAANVGDPP